MIRDLYARANGTLRRVGASVRGRVDGARRIVAGPQPLDGGLGNGVVVRGTVWAGGATEPVDGIVVIDGRGTVDYIGPDLDLAPPGLPVIGSAGDWIGPGLIDAHVHLAFGSVRDCLPSGVVGVRDLGAPLRAAHSWRTGHRPPPPGLPFVAVAGPIVTAPHGYPSQSWGAHGFATFVDSAGHARQAVHRIAAAGADVVKIALEPGDRGWPVPSPTTVRAVVDAAHDTGLAVVAHALRSDMVLRALEAGVDELAHTPTERLSEELVDRIADSGVAVVSTLQTFFSEGAGRVAAANAAALHKAGVVLRYGTDLGNTGTHTGVDPRELDRLADTGLGRMGALRAATEASAAAPGMRRRTGHIRQGEPAALVVLPADPTAEPAVWHAPIVVIADGRLTLGGRAADVAGGTATLGR